MNALYIERAIAIFGMCLWLVFPIGLFISIIKQSRETKQPSLNQGIYHYSLLKPEDHEDFLHEQSLRTKKSEPQKIKEIHVKHFH